MPLDTTQSVDSRPYLANTLPQLGICFRLQIIIWEAGRFISLINSGQVNNSFLGIKVLGSRLYFGGRWGEGAGQMGTVCIFLFPSLCAFHLLASVQTCCQFLIKHSKGK